MLLDTGIRASELIYIDHENINPITGVIQIINGKGGKFRIAYLSKKARLALRKYIEIKGVIQGALFTSRENNRLTYSGLRMLLRRRSNKAGIVYQSPHSFRRLFAITILSVFLSRNLLIASKADWKSFFQSGIYLISIAMKNYFSKNQHLWIETINLCIVTVHQFV